MPILREDQALISAGVTGITFPTVGQYPSWATFQGGDVEAEDLFTRPGAMLPGVNLGGPSKRSDITITRQYTPEYHQLLIALENATGKATMWASYQWLDANGNPIAGSTVHYTGILKTVNRPNYDANATNVAFLGLVMGADVEAKFSGS